MIQTGDLDSQLSFLATILHHFLMVLLQKVPSCGGMSYISVTQICRGNRQPKNGARGSCNSSPRESNGTVAHLDALLLVHGLPESWQMRNMGDLHLEVPEEAMSTI